MGGKKFCLRLLLGVSGPEMARLKVPVCPCALLNVSGCRGTTGGWDEMMGADEDRNPDTFSGDLVVLSACSNANVAAAAS